MPQLVPIMAVPNQNFTITLDSNLFDITIRTANGITAVSVAINGNDVIDNVRAVPGALVIPSQYQEAGNFAFLTANYQLPLYTQFNISQQLIYFTANELASFRKRSSVQFTAADFNPLASLPLRFAPQGYVGA